MNSNKKIARIAGIFYLVMALTAPISLMYIPTNLVIQNNPALTAEKIMNSELFFRFGIFSEIICQISFIFLVITLSRLFNEVDKYLTKLMTALVFIAVPIAILNELNNIAALFLLNGAGYLNILGIDKLRSFAMFFLNLREQGIMIVGFFWGLWLLPFGMLIIKSGFIPKIFGILLVIGCFSYLIDSSASLLIPQYRDILTNILMLPLSAGEISTIFWLLIKGVKDKNIAIIK